eukprot:10772833-Prorocentrum_lima.AAC.1
MHPSKRGRHLCLLTPARAEFCQPLRGRKSTLARARKLALHNWTHKPSDPRVAIRHSAHAAGVPTQ